MKQRFEKYRDEVNELKAEVERKHMKREAASCGSCLTALFSIYICLTLSAFIYSVSTVSSELDDIDNSHEWCLSQEELTNCGSAVSLRTMAILQFVANLISYVVALGFSVFGLYVTCKQRLNLASLLYKLYWV